MTAARGLLKRSLPILIPSFVNKVGTIGIALIPILLVDLHFSADASAVTMTFIKSAGLVGIFVGGILCDRFSLKHVMVLSFLVSAIAIGILPWAKTILLVSLLGMLASLGTSLFPSASGLYLKKTFKIDEQQEAVGWLRTANNAGQILSFSIGWILAGLGTAGLFLFDGLTSLFAAGFALGLMPNLYLRHQKGEVPSVDLSVPKSVVRRHLLWVTAMLAGCEVFFYELFMTSASAKLRLLKGSTGLAFFSKLMVINTVLCALLAVLASRRLKNPSWVLPFGMAFSVAGCLISFAATDLSFYAGAFLITIGEIVYMSLSNFVLLQLVPKKANAGALYGFATVFQFFGKALGSAFAFPFVVYGAHPSLLVAASATFAAVLFAVAIPAWRQLDLFN